MFDSNALFSDAQSVSADAESTNAITNNGGASGYIEVICTSFAPTSVQVWALAKDADSGWDSTDGDQIQNSVTFTGTGRKLMRVEHGFDLTKLYYDHTGSGAAVFTAGFVPAGQRDHLVQE